MLFEFEELNYCVFDFVVSYENGVFIVDDCFLEFEFFDFDVLLELIIIENVLMEIWCDEFSSV